MLACRQLRIHDSRETDFYVRMRSRPIIEATSGARFAPLTCVSKDMEMVLSQAGHDAQEAEAQGLWRTVDDFLWLKSTPSPNWTVLPEDERKLPLSV
eukprot:scaffold4372_cov397-Prasinococcus_capsulatus_cf.AAC.9